MAEHLITFLPAGQTISVTEGTNLLDAARSAGLTPNAPCGGKGTCGKCKVRLLHLPDAPEALACQTPVTGPMTVRFLSDEGKSQVISTKSDLSLGAFPADSDEGYCVAFDIGTTTVVGYLLDANGRELGSIGRLNPQMTYGADVISRIEHALQDGSGELAACIRDAMEDWLDEYIILLNSESKPKVDPIATALEAVQAQLAGLQQQQDTLCDYLEKGVYTIDMFTKRNATLAREIKKLQESEAELMRKKESGSQENQAAMEIIPTTQHILDNYDVLTIAEKNRLWKLVMKKATVYRTPEGELSVHIYPKLPK
mgnify:CR=1 FL=1